MRSVHLYLNKQEAQELLKELNGNCTSNNLANVYYRLKEQLETRTSEAKKRTRAHPWRAY